MIDDLAQFTTAFCLFERFTVDLIDDKFDQVIIPHHFSQHGIMIKNYFPDLMIVQARIFVYSEGNLLFIFSCGIEDQLQFSTLITMSFQDSCKFAVIKKRPHLENIAKSAKQFKARGLSPTSAGFIHPAAKVTYFVAVKILAFPA